MKRNVLVELSESNPGCDIVLMVSGDNVPSEPLLEAAETILESKVVASFRAKGSSGIRLMAVEPCESLSKLRTKKFSQEKITRGWPHVKIAADDIAMYLFDIHDMITLEVMLEKSIIEIVDPEVLGSETKVVMSGANLLPICRGNVEVHRVRVDNGVLEPLKMLARMATKDMLAMSGVTEVPKGFYEGIAETFMISPCEGKLDRYNMTFKGKEGNSSEEFEDLSVEQMFALFELRNTNTIQ